MCINRSSLFYPFYQREDMSEQRQSVPTLMSLGGRPANSRREIKIIDTTLRDAHQSIWATRMRTEHIIAMAPLFDKAGFEQVDLMVPIQSDVSVRYLKEDPWERVRLAHKYAPNTRFRALVRSKNIASFDFLPDDVVDAWVRQLYANGFRVIGSFDGLNDVSNIDEGLRTAKELGAHTFGALSFCESPVHTDELYVRTAIELIEKCDVDSIMLKDAGGLLTPERIRTLVPAIKEVIGDRPLELHSHCLTGLAPQVYLEAVELGCDALHTSIAPLADGNGQPATDRKSTRLNSSHVAISYAVFCLKKKKNKTYQSVTYLQISFANRILLHAENRTDKKAVSSAS